MLLCYKLLIVESGIFYLAILLIYFHYTKLFDRDISKKILKYLSAVITLIIRNILRVK